MVIREFLSRLEEDTTRDTCPDMPFLPKDKRLEGVFHTDTGFEWSAPASKARWEADKEQLRRRIAVAAGLYPMPERCPLNPRVWDTEDFEDYSVSKITFESYKGFFVTGNLYTPRGREGVFPAIINPHGHWDSGRNQRGPDSDIPARCANFAKMGFVALSYDMLGYQDSRQVTHGFGAGAANELWAVSALGLQLWNSIRCVDYLCSRGDVDAARIGCTGASGGGTQTFLLAAVDDRIAACAPVNMVSATMQGGCSCENAPLLRVGGVCNQTLAALAAPRPMLLIGSTGDWTRELESEDFPKIRGVYQLYEKGYLLESFFQDAEHNYNKQARTRVYNFFARHLLGRDIIWREREVSLEGKALAIGGRAESGILGNAAVSKMIRHDRLAAAARLWESDPAAAREYYREAMALVLGVSDCRLEQKDRRDASLRGYRISRGFLTDGMACIPWAELKRQGADPKRLLLTVHPDGKWAALDTLLSEPRYGQALESGTAAAASPDLFLTGDFQRPYALCGRNAVQSVFFTTFNYTDAAYRMQDLVRVVRSAEQMGYEEIELIGWDAARFFCLAAMPFAGESVLFKQCPEETPDETFFIKHMFIPCFLSVGGLDTCRKLWEGRKKYHEKA